MVVALRVWTNDNPARVPAAVARALLPYSIPTSSGEVTDGTITAWAFLLFALAVVGLFGLVLWRVMEATLLRLH